MAKLVDYPCPRSDFQGLLTIEPASLGLEVPGLYQKAEDMAAMVTAMTKEKGGGFCRLPVDTIAVAENLGASVIYDQSPTGPRKKEDVIGSAAEALELPPADPERGRMREIMKGISILASEGELPAFGIKGLFDTMNFLLDLQKLIMDFSMDPGVFQQVSDRIRGDLVRLCQAAEAAGARVITYEDGSGSLNVIGPRFAKKAVDVFLWPLMKELTEKLSEKTLIHLCPKAAFQLTGCGRAEFREKEADPEKSWIQNALDDPGIRLTGSQCSHHIGRKVEGKLVWMELAE